MNTRNWIMLAVLGISALSLAVAAWLSKHVISQDAGTPQMQKISNAIKQGAEAFLRRQNKTIGLLALILAVIIYVAYAAGKGDSQLAIRMTVAFVAGSMAAVLFQFRPDYVRPAAIRDVRIRRALAHGLDRATPTAEVILILKHFQPFRKSKSSIFSRYCVRTVPTPCCRPDSGTACLSFRWPGD